MTLPPWNVVWASFRRWRDTGALERAHEALRPLVRQRAGTAAHRRLSRQPSRAHGR